MDFYRNGAPARIRSHLYYRMSEMPSMSEPPYTFVYLKLALPGAETNTGLHRAIAVSSSRNSPVTIHELPEVRAPSPLSGHNNTKGNDDHEVAA